MHHIQEDGDGEACEIAEVPPPQQGAAAKGADAGPWGRLAPDTRDGAHTVSPSLQVIKALPAFWRDTMCSTEAIKP